jgi:hypothetical protein
MKTLHTLLAATLLALSPLAQAADVGVSVVISQPGVYGRVEFGRFPPPQVVVVEPVVMRPVRVVYPAPEPALIWVPHGHRKKWHRHCHRYDACDRPVRFVRDRDHGHHDHRGWRRDRDDDDD